MSKRFKVIVYIVAGLLFINLTFLGYGHFFLKSGVPQGHLRVVFLDVGQGDAILVQSFQGYNVLIDGGPDKDVIYRLDQYVPFYNRRIDLLISTHEDLDHITGLVEVLKRYKVKKILTNGLKNFSPAAMEWEKLIKQKNIPRQVIDAPLDVILDKQTFLQFFWPQQELTKDLKGDDNFASLVFKLKHGNNRFLFTGDADKKTEEELIKLGCDLKADVLKVGHHGSKYSSDIDFLRLIEPKYGVLSVGENNPFGHPSLRVLKNLEEVNVKILRTDQMGDIVFLSDGKNLSLTF